MEQVEVDEILCRKCKAPFTIPYGKRYQNCEPCRLVIRDERKNRPKYNPETHKICHQCRAVKAIQSEFVITMDKRTNKCTICRNCPVEKKEKEEVVDVQRVLRTVYKNLEKIIDEPAAVQLMHEIEAHVFEEEGAPSVE